MKIIRTSRHSVKFSNKQKREYLNSFIASCRNVIHQYVYYLWFNSYSFKNKCGLKVLDIQNEKYNLPRFISNVKLEKLIPEFSSNGLSARVKKCLLTQAIGIIKASIEKQRKRKFQIDKGVHISNGLLRNYRNNFNKFPNLENINIELNSLCCSVISKDSNSFNLFFKLASLGKSFNNLYIPIKFHRHSNKIKNNSFKMMTSFLISENYIDIRWVKDIENKSKGNIVGADQGKIDILTLSDGQITPKEDIHGHTLDSILRKLSRKRKGSKKFHKAQLHRENFIHWALNRLNLSNISQINLENVKNLFYKKKVSRLMKHWSYSTIADKVKSLAEISGVHVQLNSSTYRSQRCSKCGMVRKSNRMGKTYSCKNCGFTIDADFNASLNHEIELPSIPIVIRNLKMNIKGFFWKPNGFFSLDGEEIAVPLSST